MPDEFLAPIAKEVRTRSAQKWGTEEEIHIVGQSPSILEAQKQIKRFSTTDRPVLITGESGTGKELFAKSLFLSGNRSDKPFRCTNCAQYQEGDLLVSELFGHRKGSFTGANKDYEGLFASADGGTAFLDEIGELSPKAQAMLLRTLSEGEIKPVGSTESKQVDVRVVAATNRPLEEMVGNGSFRKDLFYRLNYLRVHLPPVRGRGDDWRLLVRFFLNRLNRKNRTQKDLTTAAWSVLEDYHWPGNIREIKSILDVGFCLSGSHIEPDSFEHALDFERSNEEAKKYDECPDDRI
jgi:Transcriptional regulator containing PAS, AAA-type ATPase, and DNA-binding domains